MLWPSTSRPLSIGYESRVLQHTKANLIVDIFGCDGSAQRYACTGDKVPAQGRVARRGKVTKYYSVTYSGLRGHCTFFYMSISTSTNRLEATTLKHSHAQSEDSNP